MNLKNWLVGLPDILQYVAVIGLVLVILYVCLTLTRLLGQNRGEKIRYDNPEEYEKTVPDIFASTAFKRKPKAEKDAEANTKENENAEKKDH